MLILVTSKLRCQVVIRTILQKRFRVVSKAQHLNKKYFILLMSVVQSKVGSPMCTKKDFMEPRQFRTKFHISLTLQMMEDMQVFSKGPRTFDLISYLTAGQGLKIFERLLLDRLIHCLEQN